MCSIAPLEATNSEVRGRMTFMAYSQVSDLLAQIARTIDKDLVVSSTPRGVPLSSP